MNSYKILLATDALVMSHPVNARVTRGLLDQMFSGPDVKTVLAQVTEFIEQQENEDSDTPAPRMSDEQTADLKARFAAFRAARST